jgi:hypothetical protein
MSAGPIATILAGRDPAGYWVKPGAGYSPKYRGTVWQIIFLDQLGADGADPRVRESCAYVLANSQTPSGGFGSSGAKEEVAPPSSRAIHCLNGNLLGALIGFGWLEDDRVRRAIDWQARSITGEGFGRYYATGASGPDFRCGANEGQPCAWGAIKALLALGRVPPERRAPHVARAIDRGAAFLLSRDPAVADYPMGWGNAKPNGSWFKPGFPIGYVADVLQNLEALCALGFAGDPRLRNALAWLVTQQDERGRWRNRYAYNGKTWEDVERQGAPGKRVTLRACRVLKMAYAQD